MAIGIAALGVAAIAFVAVTGIDKSAAEVETEKYEQRRAAQLEKLAATNAEAGDAPETGKTKLTRATTIASNHVMEALKHPKITRNYKGKSGTDRLETTFATFNTFSAAGKEGALDVSGFERMMASAGVMGAVTKALWLAVNTDGDGYV